MQRRRSLHCKVAAVLAVVCLTGLSAFAASSGLLRIKGSDTLLPLSAAWAEAYMAKHPDTAISVTGGGSGVGLAGLINRSCDIANASRAAKKKEISQGRDRNVAMKATTVALDGIAVVVHPGNTVKGLTMTQLARLYSGARTWKDVGGSSATVVAAGRDSSSGTYVFFQEKVLKGKRYRTDVLTLPSNNSICQSVSQDKGGIGYVGLAFAEEFARKKKVKILSIDGVAPSSATVSNGKYPLRRALYCYTSGTPRGAAADFVKYATSPEGQKIVRKMGYVPK